MNYLLHLQKISLSPRISHIGLRSVSSVFSSNYSNVVIQNKLFVKVGSPCVSSNRTFWETFPYIERSLYVKDGFNPDEYQIVHRNRIFNYLFYGQVISQGVILAQILYCLNFILQVYVLHNPMQAPQSIGDIPIIYDFTSYILLNLFSFQALCVYYITQLMILRIYYRKDSNEHIIISMSHNPFKVRKTFCKKSDIENLHLKGAKAFLGNFRCKGRKFFINPSTFRSTLDYARFVGNYED